MINPNISLRTKILWIISVMAMATIAAMALIVIFFVKPRLEAKLEKRGQSIAHAISYQSINPILARRLFEVDLLFREFVNSESGVEYMYVRSASGEITAHSFGREFPAALLGVKPKIDRNGRGTARISTTDRDIIEISLPILDGALGRLHVGMSAASIKEDVDEILLAFAGIGVLFCLSSLLLLVSLERWVIRPIFEIKSAAATIGKGDLDQRVAIVSGDEIGALANEFNGMVDAIKESRASLVEEKSLLAQSEERFRTIIQKSPISMALVSLDGTIEYINDYAVATFGYLPEDIPHMSNWWLKAYPDATYREQVIAKWMGLVENAAAGNGYIERREYLVTCKSGSRKTVLIFGILLLNRVFVVFEDITERKLAEDKINQLNTELEKIVAERTEELQRINRDLASFCYAISHELNAPVARLKGLSQALQEVWAEDPADAVFCVRRIEAASIELQRVIDSVLQLSRLSQSSFVPQPINLSLLVREIAGTIMNDVGERQIDFVIAEDITTCGDASLVRLCLENLLVNACKYTSRQPAARIEFGKDVASNAFFIRDNGIGFDMAYADKLFEPFTRLHSEDEFAGSGIGLATVQRVIERHGGRIWADAAPGQGATFYFTLTPCEGDGHAA